MSSGVLSMRWSRTTSNKKPAKKKLTSKAMWWRSLNDLKRWLRFPFGAGASGKDEGSGGTGAAASALMQAPFYFRLRSL
jgi:hypothetical protein